MVAIKNYMTEIIIYIIAFFTLLFTATNVSKDVSQIYLWFLSGAIIILLVTILIFDKRVDVTIKKNNTSWIEEFFYGATGWVVLLGTSYLVLNYFKPGTTIGSIFASLNAANPVFSNSVIMNFIIIAGLIPLSETAIFARALELISDWFGVRVSNNSKTNIKAVIIIIVLSSVFLIFHATAKSSGAGSLSGSGPSLFIVFVMMGISLALIFIRNGDMRSALIVHFLANGVAAYLAIQSSGGLTFALIPLFLIGTQINKSLNNTKNLELRNRRINEI